MCLLSGGGKMRGWLVSLGAVLITILFMFIMKDYSFFEYISIYSLTYITIRLILFDCDMQKLKKHIMEEKNG